MDTFIKLPTGQLVNKRYADARVLSAASSGLYKEVDASGSPLFSAQQTSEKKSPVASISTESAVSNLERSQENLNRNYPTTAPGYIAPTVKEKPQVKLPKAYFTNENGQEAEYDESQLKDPSTREFLERGGFVMTKTEGPTVLAGELAETNKKIQKLFDEFNSYNVDSDPGFQSIADSIRKKYGALQTQMAETNKGRAGAIQTTGVRGGASRYAGAIQMGIEGEELNQANQRMAELVSQEASVITEARSAYEKGKYGLYNEKIAALEKIRENKTKELVSYNETLSAAQKKFNETVGQASRDSAIADLLGQGITDPAELLDFLNYSKDGEQVGDFTAEEVQKTLKSLTAGGKDWQEKLSGTTRDFYILKDQGKLPGNIPNLPEEQQLSSYLQFIKTASTLGTKKKDNVFTLSEIIAARKAGLPIPYSAVGKSEADILKDLSSDTPPPWFKEKAETELQQSLTPDSLQEIWDQYKEEQSTEAKNEFKPNPKPATNFKKARQYFESSYDGLDDGQLDTLATQVETYANGGMSYADAVEQTIKDIE